MCSNVPLSLFRCVIIIDLMLSLLLSPCWWWWSSSTKTKSGRIVRERVNEDCQNFVLSLLSVYLPWIYCVRVSPSSPLSSGDEGKDDVDDGDEKKERKKRKIDNEVISCLFHCKLFFPHLKLSFHRKESWCNRTDREKEKSDGVEMVGGFGPSLPPLMQSESFTLTT